ncbi:hypothetical protein [Dactylosporangium sp. NPDC000521]|uniref:hypothetical protein n=1 Tax=Dactylosporangium sp. NPDC000521 TaxID=3363975 RepID=UPI0036B5577E
MRRRTVLAAGGALAGSLLSGKAQARPAVVQWPMFEWEKQRGLFPPGIGVMVPPPLAVYGDGEAYADAASHQYLPAEEAKALQTHAVQVLGERANLRRRPDADRPGDTPSDRLRVRTADGHYLTAHLDGWGDGDPGHEFPAALHELYDHVQVLRRRVRADGKPWAADALLLVAVYLDAEPGEREPWPTSVPAPGVRPDRRYCETKLTGAKARKVRRDLPRSDEHVWPSYRTPAGSFVAANWRFNLPHEW